MVTITFSSFKSASYSCLPASYPTEEEAFDAAAAKAQKSNLGAMLCENLDAVARSKARWNPAPWSLPSYVSSLGLQLHVGEAQAHEVSEVVSWLATQLKGKVVYRQLTIRSGTKPRASPVVFAELRRL